MAGSRAGESRTGGVSPLNNVLVFRSSVSGRMDRKALNLFAGRGVAVREVIMAKSAGPR